MVGKDLRIRCRVPLIVLACWNSPKSPIHPLVRSESEGPLFVAQDLLAKHRGASG
jgi:hypothetical protein